MKFRPLNDRILIERIEEEITTSGIVIPDNAKEKPSKGKVLSVGNGKLLENGNVFPLVVKINDIVLFGKYAGTDVKIDGKDYLVIREEDVMGILE